MREMRINPRQTKKHSALTEYWIAIDADIRVKNELVLHLTDDPIKYWWEDLFGSLEIK